MGRFRAIEAVAEDPVAAAARILDPVFDGVNRYIAEGKTPLFGVFLKDYHETEW